MNIYDFDERDDDLTEFVAFKDNDYIYFVQKSQAERFKTLTSKRMRGYEADVIINREGRSLTKSRFF